jgi:fibro-slime domain-containing protein
MIATSNFASGSGRLLGFSPRSRAWSALFLFVAASSAACGGSDDDAGDLLGGVGGGSSTGARPGLGGTPGIGFGGGPGNGGNSPGGGNGSGGDCNPRFFGLLRDFKAAHPNMEEKAIVTEKGIVGAELGPNRKPVFAGNGLKSVTNAADFDQWYRDTPGTNETFEHEIVFTQGANGRAVYDNSNFFPLDGRGFGNEGQNHNFHFTFELHMQFEYRGGEVFRFRGDDDLWVFINDRLALDLGGVHGALNGQVDLDAMATALGISAGNTYALDFFHAERHTSESNFLVETNLVFTNCTPILVR